MVYPRAEKLISAISAHFLSFRKLSAQRILGIGFLCDWKHCIEYESPITECNWSVVGNWVDSEEFLYELYLSEHLRFPVQKRSASPSVVKQVTYPYLPGSSEDTVCQHVFSALEKRTDFDLDKIILSTYPFDHTGPIDMALLSREYVLKYGREYLRKLRA